MIKGRNGGCELCFYYLLLCHFNTYTKDKGDIKESENIYLEVSTKLIQNEMKKKSTEQTNRSSTQFQHRIIGNIHVQWK